MTDEEADVLRAQIFAVKMITQFLLSDTFKATGNPRKAGRDLVEGVLRMEEGVRNAIGSDHPFALKVTESLTSLIDQAIAIAEKDD